MTGVFVLSPRDLGSSRLQEWAGAEIVTFKRDLMNDTDIEALVQTALQLKEENTSLLPASLLAARKRVEEPADPCRLHSLTAPDGFLSLSKSLRVGSEIAGTHRLRQMVRVAEDFLAGKEGFPTCQHDLVPAPEER